MSNFVREPACSILATELMNVKDVSCVELEDGKTKNIITTEIGTNLNRIFCVGLLSEVTESESSQFMKGKILSNSGAFYVNAGQYQPEAASFLQEHEDNVPIFVAVVGKVNVFEPEPGKMITSIRPEMMTLSDEETRNYWLQDAVGTLEKKMVQPSFPEELREKYSKEIQDIKLFLMESQASTCSIPEPESSPAPNNVEEPEVPPTPAYTPEAAPSQPTQNSMPAQNVPATGYDANPSVASTPSPTPPSTPDTYPSQPVENSIPSPETPGYVTETPAAVQSPPAEPSQVPHTPNSNVPDNSPSGLTEDEDRVVDMICELSSGNPSLISVATVANRVGMDFKAIDRVMRELVRKGVVIQKAPGFIEPINSFNHPVPGNS